MELIETDCNVCEQPIVIEVSEDYGQLVLEFTDCPNCRAEFNQKMRDRIAEAFYNENLFSNVIGR